MFDFVIFFVVNYVATISHELHRSEVEGEAVEVVEAPHSVATGGFEIVASLKVARRREVGGKEG